MKISRASRWGLLAIYYLIFGAAYIVLLLRQSEDPVLLGYSLRYIVILAVSAFGFFLPAIATKVFQRLGLKKLAFAMVPLCILVVWLYIGGSVYYYHSQKLKVYDPFLQLPPERFAVGTKTSDTLRILAMGGSTTIGSLYPERLGKVLRERYPERRVEVLNAGVPWWTSKHSLINYVTYGRSLQADIILVMHGINDLYRSFTPLQSSIGEYKDDWSHFYGPTIRTARRPTFEEAILTPLIGVAYAIVEDRPVDFPVQRFESLGPFEQHMAGIARYVVADGTRVAFLTQPSIYRPDLSPEDEKKLMFNFVFCKQWSGFLKREYPSVSAMAGAMHAANEITRGVAARQGVPLIDVASRVPKDWDHFTDDVHHTDQAGNLIGGLVAEELIRSGWIAE